jgi:hypothetical protein
MVQGKMKLLLGNKESQREGEGKVVRWRIGGSEKEGKVVGRT